MTVGRIYYDFKQQSKVTMKKTRKLLKKVSKLIKSYNSDDCLKIDLFKSVEFGVKFSNCSAGEIQFSNNETHHRISTKNTQVN